MCCSQATEEIQLIVVVGQYEGVPVIISMLSDIPVQQTSDEDRSSISKSKN